MEQLLNLLVRAEIDTTHPYKNEFDTMGAIFQDYSKRGKRYGEVCEILHNLEQEENFKNALKTNIQKVQESKFLRQQGNSLFTAKSGRRNILGACRFYNEAIYAALDTTNSEELALGFANRAAALKAFGYYQQAYDDCVCALELGYPEHLRAKIIMRQACCSIKMRDLNKAELCLNVLLEMTLSAAYSKELDELLDAFDVLKREVDDGNENLDTVKEISLNRETQEIIHKEDGRIMQAKCQIKKNQLIFTERASAFVPVGHTRGICQQCGTTNFIPIPCLHCRGRVNYCSLKCKDEHIGIHTYECPAYRMQLFINIGIGHLVLRIVLDNGLLSILNELKLNNKSSTLSVWRNLTEGGKIWKSSSIPYAESLRMISHLYEWSHVEIQSFAVMSHLLVGYLKCCTKYFEVLNATNNNIDWEHLTGSLILRHFGQSTANGHSLTAIVPRPINTLNKTEFVMLNEDVWSSPWHIKLGCLNIFSYYEVVASLNLPYLSLCNHSCVQMLQTKFSGRFISTYALRNIKKGKEITNCYYLDCRKINQDARRERLRDIYNFECLCESCRQTGSKDVDFNEFHQFRCDNSKCRQIFVPNISLFDLLEVYPIRKVFCTKCGQKQTFEWCRDVKNLLSAVGEAKTRCRLYKMFKESEQYLVGLNECRCSLAQRIIFECFQFFKLNVIFNEQDYVNLVDMTKYILNVLKKQCSVNSVSYVIDMIYLWDIMAKRKYKCSKAEIDEMLFALNILPDDLNMIFLNYYNDYIKDYLNF